MKRGASVQVNICVGNPQLLIILLVFLLFIPILTVSADENQLTGTDLLFAEIPAAQLPEDPAVGQLFEAEPGTYEAEVVTAVQTLMTAEPESDAWEQLLAQYVSTDTVTMFRILNKDTLFPRLPAETVLFGQPVEAGGTVRIRVRLFFAEDSASGDVFFRETDDGWKIVSSVFDFSAADS